MILTIQKPISFNELGKRDNQEDYRWPLPEEASENGRVFIVCDGVGGHEGGEVASSTVANAIGSFLSRFNWNEQYMVPEMMESAVEYAYSELDKKDNGAERKMATTLTCIVLHRGGVFLAHMGDSRIYHVRPNQTGVACVEYVTLDHSAVNDLVRLGEITPEEAINHPMKNQITRCLMPNQDIRCKASVQNITDVKPGDYFFLCTDGVLENLTQNQLGKILSREDISNEQKLESIKDICFDKTKDNHTCYLVQVESVTAEVGDVAENEDVVPVFDDSSDVSGKTEASNSGNRGQEGGTDKLMSFFDGKTNRLIIMVWLLLLTGILLVSRLFPPKPIIQIQVPPAVELWLHNQQSQSPAQLRRESNPPTVQQQAQKPLVDNGIEQKPSTPEVKIVAPEQGKDSLTENNPDLCKK